MPNHGYCKNCWWWKIIPTLGPYSPEIEQGCCWMHCGDNGIPYSITNEDSYCPDYWNRKKGNKEDGTLEEWIKKYRS